MKNIDVTDEKETSSINDSANVISVNNPAQKNHSPPNAATSVTNTFPVELEAEEDEVDNEVDDVAEDGNRTFSFKLGERFASRSVPFVKDANLIQIGKHIKQLEANMLKKDERNHKDFNERKLPGLNAEIKILDNEINELRARLKREFGMGSTHLQNLDKAIDSLLDKQDIIKRECYFQNSAVTLGSRGLYYAYDEFWLENASGKYKIEIVPGSSNNNTNVATGLTHPTISLLLTGTTDDNSGNIHCIYNNNI